MEIGRIIKLKWLMNHNTYIGVVDVSVDDFYVLREPCIVIIHKSGDVVSLYERTTINKIYCEEEKIKENDLFLLWKEIDKNYSENRKDFEEIVFKEIEKIKRSR